MLVYNSYIYVKISLIQTNKQTYRQTPLLHTHNVCMEHSMYTEPIVL